MDQGAEAGVDPTSASASFFFLSLASLCSSNALFFSGRFAKPNPCAHHTRTHVNSPSSSPVIGAPLMDPPARSPDLQLGALDNLLAGHGHLVMMQPRY